MQNMIKSHKKVRFFFCLYVALITIISFVTVAFATDDPLAVVNNLSTFIFGLIRAIGLILLGWGIVQVGLSLKSHDPSQRANGFLTLAGGIVITFAKEILDLITGG
ncbi:MAG: glutamyl-tRNA amidotransferase [Christensenella sp.]